MFLFVFVFFYLLTSRGILETNSGIPTNSFTPLNILLGFLVISVPSERRPEIPRDVCTPRRILCHSLTLTCKTIYLYWPTGVRGSVVTTSRGNRPLLSKSRGHPIWTWTTPSSTNKFGQISPIAFRLFKTLR